jgi:hypothetical protein
MRAVKDVLIVLLLAVIAFMTVVQEDDVTTLKKHAFTTTGGLYMNHQRLIEIESGLSVGYDLSGPLAVAAVLKTEKIVTDIFGIPQKRAFNASGVFVSENMLLTAKHVVEDRVSDASLTVITNCGITFSVIEILEDQDDDMALVVIDGVYGPHLKVGSRPRLGDHVMCVGSPFKDEFKKLLVTWARIVGEDWQKSFIYDGFAYHGCSGGPVIKDGRLVGIIRARLQGTGSLGVACYLDRLDPEILDRIR